MNRTIRSAAEGGNDVVELTRDQGIEVDVLGGAPCELLDGGDLERRQVLHDTFIMFNRGGQQTTKRRNRVRSGDQQHNNMKNATRHMHRILAAADDELSS